MRARHSMSPDGAESTLTLPVHHQSAEQPENRMIIGTRVDVTSYAQATAAIARWTSAPHGRYICVCSVHPVIEARDDPRFRDIMNGADLVTPDGVPLVWALRLLGASVATRVYGPDLTSVVCSWAAESGTPVGFYGSTPAVLERLTANLSARYPTLHINYRQSPPFRPLSGSERQSVIDAIRASGIRVLFVGLGCPKQERWMAEQREELDVVMLGVGAAFDYLAGTLRRPPAWIQRIGLEWLFRLLIEPRRLWRRYLRNNPRFLVLFAKQYVSFRRGGGN
jgi:N-acetylglucosaminyldiphosphoundecaprenol N-acetyl-beta-D-mannosaminyltransferase